MSLVIFTAARMFMKLADLLLSFAVPLVVFQSTNSVRWAGLAFFVEKLPRLFFLPFGGWLVDHFSPRRMLITSDTARGLILAFAFVGLKQWPEFTPWIVGFAAAANALLNAQSFVALENLMSQSPKDIKRVRGFMALQMVDQGNVVMAPVLATSLLVVLAPASIFALAAGLYLLSAALIFFQTSVDTPKSVFLKKSPLQGIYLGVGWIAKSPKLINLGLQTMAVNLMLGMSIAGGAALVLGKLGLDAKQYGILQIVGGCTSLLSMLVMPCFNLEKSISRLGKISFLVMVLGCTTMGLADGFAGVVAGYIFLLTPAGVYNVCLRTMRAEAVPLENRGSIVAVHILLGQLSLPMVGLLLSRFSAAQVQLPFIVCGLLSLLVFGAGQAYRPISACILTSLRSLAR